MPIDARIPDGRGLEPPSAMIAKKRRVIVRRILLAAGTITAVYFALFFSERPRPAPGSVPIRVSELVEASGLAPSHHAPDMLWSHNDSGGQPVLYGFATTGEPRGRIRIIGVKNIDWEAISSFEMEGKAWIAIGDVGDNSDHRTAAVIHVIEEPPLDRLSPSHETIIPVAWSVAYRYEDGPHDCETLMVDSRLREFLLITKRTAVPGIYHLPLRPVQPAALAVAKKIGTVGHVPQPNLKQKLFPVPAGRFRDYVTDGAISPDGLSAAILTYGDVLIYYREHNESWSTALQREPQQLNPHGLQQGEAVCFSRDGKELFVTGEQKHPLLLRYAVPIHRGK